MNDTELPGAPFDFMDAVRASRDASHDQKLAEDYMKDKAKSYAEAERAYRKALARKIIQLKDGGMAVTAAADVARGAEDVAELKYTRDLEEGLKEAAAQSIWRHTADRRELEHFIDWSKRAAFISERVAA